MTAEQVIKVIETEKTCVERAIKGCNRDCGHCDLVMPDKDVIECYNMAISALEKQIPKKPIEKEVIGASTTGYKYKGQCPKCSSTVSQYTGNYCHHCGQALDWSD